MKILSAIQIFYFTKLHNSTSLEIQCYTSTYTGCYFWFMVLFLAFVNLSHVLSLYVYFYF